MLEILTTVRHGEVYSNKLRIIPSENEALTQLGLNQARAVAEALEDYDFDIVYVSPSVRTFRTSMEIGIYHPGTALVKEPRIRDPDLGDCAGSSIDYIKEMMIPDPSFRPPNGESLDDLDRRIRAFADDLLRLEERDVLVVSHNGPIIHLLGYLLGKPREQYMELYQANGAISVVEFTTDGPKEILFNSTDHLS